MHKYIFQDEKWDKSDDCDFTRLTSPTELPLALHPADYDRRAEHFLRHYPSWRGDDRLSIRIMMTGVSRTRTQVSGNKAGANRGNNDPVLPAQWLRLNGEELKIIAGWVLCTHASLRTSPAFLTWSSTIPIPWSNSKRNRLNARSSDLIGNQVEKEFMLRKGMFI